MKKTFLSIAVLLTATAISFTACNDDDEGATPDPVTPTTTDTTGTDTTNTTGLHNAFADFDTVSFTVTKNGDNVTITTDGLPNHTSPYWSNTKTRTLNGPMGTRTTGPAASNHPLWVEATVATEAQMAPGNIDDFNGSYSLTVPVSPTIASSTSSTGLGAIGFAVSGSVIYNDEEGPNVPLDNAVPSLDYNGAHTGPQSYHYHLEPIAFSDDDDKLVGIISDGFFIYGRKCNSTGTYPTDLDVSGGHTSTTQHTTTAEYHYHIENTTTTINGTGYYIIFPEDYQGTPNAIR